MNKHLLKGFFLSLLLLCLFGNAGLAQKALLKGKITDGDNNEPLIGATVILDGTSTGTTTDYDGNYELSVDKGTHVVVISYIGYQDLKQEVTLDADEKMLDITLSQGVVMDEVVVTSERGEKSIMDVVGTIEVLKPDVISQNASTSVDEALEVVPGVQIIDGQANIRGGSGYSYGAGSRVMLLIDGIPALAGDAAFPNWDDVPVENIDQVEVLKGAGSALYGSSALNGVINIKTAFAKSDPETEFSAFYTSYRTPENEKQKWWGKNDAPNQVGMSFAHRQKFGKLDAVIGTYLYQQHSWRKDTDNRYVRGNIGLRYRINDRLMIGTNANLNAGSSNGYLYWQGYNVERDADGNATAGIDSISLYPDPSATTETEKLRYTIDPFINYGDGYGNRHRIQGRFYSVANDNSNNQSNNSQLYYGEYQFLREFEGIGITTTAGLVGIHTNVQAELYSDTTFSAQNLAAYVQFDKTFLEDTGKPLNVTLGGRYEQNVINTPEVISLEGREDILVPNGKTKEGRPVFRFGLNYKLFEYTNIRASWGQGYRFPTIAEKFVNTSAGIINIFPNTDLQSEFGWNAEFGIKQFYQIPNTDFKGLFDVSFFWTEYQDMMEFTLNIWPEGLGFKSINIGDTEIKGVDISLGGTGDLTDKINIGLIAGYTFLDPKFKEWDIAGKDLLLNADVETTPRSQLNARNSSSDVNILKYRFKHSFKANLQLGVYDFILGTTFNRYSTMDAIDEAFNVFLPGIENYRDTHDGPLAIWDFRFGYNVNENFSVNFLVKNAFNLEYAIRPGLMDAPRNFTLKTDFRF